MRIYYIQINMLNLPYHNGSYYFKAERYPSQNFKFFCILWKKTHLMWIIYPSILTLLYTILTCCHYFFLELCTKYHHERCINMCTFQIEFPSYFLWKFEKKKIIKVMCNKHSYFNMKSRIFFIVCINVLRISLCLIEKGSRPLLEAYFCDLYYYCRENIE